jgi:hypothetical protein
MEGENANLKAWKNISVRMDDFQQFKTLVEEVNVNIAEIARKQEL